MVADGAIAGADLGEEAEGDGADRGDDAADIVRESRAGGTEERREERREAHGEEGEGALGLGASRSSWTSFQLPSSR